MAQLWHQGHSSRDINGCLLFISASRRKVGEAGDITCTDVGLQALGNALPWNQSAPDLNLFRSSAMQRWRPLRICQNCYGFSFSLAFSDYPNTAENLLDELGHRMYLTGYPKNILDRFQDEFEFR